MIYSIINLILAFQANSQGGFNITYQEGVNSGIHSIGYTKTDHLAISGFIRSTDTARQGVFIAFLDTIGNIIEWTNFTDPQGTTHLGNTYESGLAITDHNEVKIVLNFIGRPSIGTISKELGNDQIIKEYIVDTALVVIPRDVVACHDGFLFTGTYQHKGFNVDAFILKTNFSGDSLWMRTYGHPTYSEISRTITVINENEYVISGARYQINQMPEFDHGWAISVDSLGNKNWEWEASEDEEPHRAIMSMQYDSSSNTWIYISFLEKQFYIEDLGHSVGLLKPILVHRDSVMNLLSYTSYGPYSYDGYMAALERSPDGGFVAAGRYTCVTDDYPFNDCNLQAGRVISTTYDGTLKWSVIDTAFFHPDLGSRSFLSGVTVSPSGSVYAVGLAYNYDENDDYRSYGWLLKITADGCVDTLCTTTSLLNQLKRRSKNVNVYPVPTTDHLIFEYDKDLNNVHVEILDLHGHLLQRQEIKSQPTVVILDTYRFLAGIYLWRVMANDGQLIDAGKFIVR